MSGTSGRARIPELSNIPWQGPKSITEYAKLGRDLARDFGTELNIGADELYEVLVRSHKGHPVLALFGAPDVRLRARRVSGRPPPRRWTPPRPPCRDSRITTRRPTASRTGPSRKATTRWMRT